MTSDAISGLFPGGADVSVTVHVSNPGSRSQFVNDISGTVANNGGCLGSSFTTSTFTGSASPSAGR